MEQAHYLNVNENQCGMCMPLGAILALKGVEGSMVIIHGSQGCSTYMRRHIAEHFNEPIDVASSSLNEKGTIYGGEASLKKGLDNSIKLYKPKVVGILTTCLAETIGEDIDRIAADYLEERGFENLQVVTVSTPGYGYSHFEGYFLAVKRVVAELVKKTVKHKGINIIVPNISPADIREIKRILKMMKVSYILLPDFSDTLDRAFERPYRKVPAGGTKLADIAGMAGAQATIQMGVTVDEVFSPGHYLESAFGVPLYNVPVPIGVENTDLFINLLKRLTGNPVPESLERERGRLIDCMIDSHKYNAQGKCVVFGEPENIYAVAGICLENGITPVVTATGGKSGKLAGLLKARLNEAGCSNAQVLCETDFSRIREKSREMEANIAIGHSGGRYLTEWEGIPLVRYGFPIHDRVGGQRLLSVGYAGTTMLLDRITNTLLENKYKNYRRNIYQQFYYGTIKPAGKGRGEKNELRLQPGAKRV
ncbi:nitrogenase [Pelotomaculum isophthalicicum JI]|uniref:Nitrogenase n=2 Tax=Pelotomaculum TaxID=191373 RepID=A0A9X4JVS9_9FIRM|nr:nitrogenase component 1 [Pelotomaculum isophthalicicum]MDF9408906.1 nitrogenase [Pelotomaculum isophthalicicum JI]